MAGAAPAELRTLAELEAEVNGLIEKAGPLQNDEPFGGLSIVVLCDRARELLHHAAGAELSENHYRANQMISHASELYAAFNPENNEHMNGISELIPYRDLDHLKVMVGSIVEYLDEAIHADDAPLFLMQTIRVLSTKANNCINLADGVEYSVHHRQAIKLVADADLFFGRWWEPQP